MKRKLAQLSKDEQIDTRDSYESEAGYQRENIQSEEIDDQEKFEDSGDHVKSSLPSPKRRKDLKQKEEEELALLLLRGGENFTNSDNTG